MLAAANMERRSDEPSRRPRSINFR